MNLLHAHAHNDVIEVKTAEHHIAVGPLDIENALARAHNCDIERASAEIKHENILVFFESVEVASQCCCSRLIDNALYCEAGDLRGIFSCLPLRCVEVCWHGNNCVLNLSAAALLCDLLHIPQNGRRNLLRFPLQ